MSTLSCFSVVQSKINKYCEKVCFCSSCTLWYNMAIFAPPTMQIEMFAIHYSSGKIPIDDCEFQCPDNTEIFLGLLIFFLMFIQQLISILKCYKHLFRQDANESKEMVNKDFHFVLSTKLFVTVYVAVVPVYSRWPSNVHLGCLVADAILFALGTSAALRRMFYLEGKGNNDAKAKSKDDDKGMIFIV